MQKQIKNIYEKYWLDIGAVLLCALLFGGGLLLIKTSKEEKQPIEIIGEGNGQTETTATDVGNVKAAETQLIDINTADTSELDGLPGIGEKTAKKIIDYREEVGDFETKENIKNVSGIGESKFSEIEDLITVE